MKYVVDPGLGGRRRHITPNQRRQLVTAHRTVDDLAHIYSSYDYINYTIGEIVRGHFQATTEFRDQFRLGERQYLPGANYRICGFLSAFKTYLESGEAILTRLSSPLYNRFKKAQHEVYDTNRWYRIGYGLRNYAQHYRFPITSAVRGYYHRDWSDKFGIRSLTEWIFTSDLNRFSGWKQIQRDDLNEIGQKFSSQELVDGISEGLETIQEAVGVDLYRRRKAAAERIRRIARLPKSFDPMTHIQVHRPDQKYWGEGHLIPADCVKIKDFGPSCPKLMRMASVCSTSRSEPSLKELGFTMQSASIPRRLK